MTKDCKTVWSNCLRTIRSSIGEQSYKTWFEPIRPVRLADNVLTIQVPSQFFYEWLEEHYVHVLKKAIAAELGATGKLEYSIIVDKGNEQHKPLAINMPTTKTSKPPQKPLPAPDKDKYTSPFELKSLNASHIQSNLNEQYTFDSYIEGDCNRLARSAGYAVANNPGFTAFNPLVIYGGVGLGKTHLVQAIGNEIKQNLPEKFVLYVSSDHFITQFVDALKNNSVQNFTNYYLQVDVLIIDDIQFLTGKEKTQENFFHIFNHLHQSGKQIIMTSDCPPKDLKGLQDRLLSRFKWGLTTDVQVPDYTTRMSIIRTKMRTAGLHIPNNVVEFLARNVDTNIRELQGVLISLMAKASLMRKDIDLELTKSTLQNIVQQTQVELNIDYIQRTVAEYLGVRVEDLISQTRKQEIASARQIAMYFCQNYTNLSLKMIGAHFGDRDHSTVAHASKAVMKKAEADESYKSMLEGIKLKMRL